MEKIMRTLKETFVEELKDIYDAEKQLIKALPKMAKAADHAELKEAIENHLGETQTQAQRLEEVFDICGEKVKSKKCKAMEGLIAEGKDVIDEEEGDAALICAAQKVEHYEIASYGSLCAWAKLLNWSDAEEILTESLNEEKNADEKLTEIAESVANIQQVGEVEETTARRKAA